MNKCIYRKFYQSNSCLEIVNINLVDVKTGTIWPNVKIIIKDDKIYKIDKNYTLNNNKILSTNWAIPGLIDSHVHLFEIHEGENKGRILKSEFFEYKKQRAIKNINDALSVGITCVRDVGAYKAYNNKLRDMIEKDPQKYKFRIISCGNHITKKNGHWHDRGVIWDSNKCTLSEAVTNELLSGSDFIKVMNDDPIFNLSELREISTACKRMKRKFACHAFTEKTISIALMAGADTIEHAACFSEDFCQSAIINDVSVCPTLVAAIDSANPLYLKDILNFNDDCQADDFRNWKNFLLKHLPRTLKSDVRIIAGTDAGTFPTSFNSLPIELKYFCDLGASNLKALQSATINAAKALGIDNITGSLDENKSADIVILSHNPLKNLYKALSKIKIVISRGQIAFTNLN